MNADSVCPPHQTYLYGPWLDFLLLSGASLIALPTLVAWIGNDPERLALSMGYSLLAANLINHPHFAHSYQIFYSNFRVKLNSYPAPLPRLYLFAGIIAPLLLLTSLFALVAFNVPAKTLGLAVNVMFFFVGWHYVKQGYGMAMVDAVLKRAFYNEAEKKTLLHNAYAVWMFSWLLANALLQGQKSYWGIPYSALPLPPALPWIAGLYALTTSVRFLAMVAKRRSANQAIAWNGLLAYSTSLYVWLLVRHPAVLIWAPLFHSLQYLAVVWRFKINQQADTASNVRPALRHAVFLLLGIALGYAGFSVVPSILNHSVDYARDTYGPTLFLFGAWVFINIHHYFMDTVMWRKGNPDVQAHLFSH